MQCSVLCSVVHFPAVLCCSYDVQCAVCSSLQYCGVLLVCSVLIGYGMVWYGMVWYGMVWYGMVCIVQFTAVLCCIYGMQCADPSSE